MIKRLLARVNPYWISLFYFALGFIFVFPSVNIWLFLKDTTGLDPGMLMIEMQMVDLPWLFKPVYAWMSDRFPIAGYRRKSYVILFSLYCSIMWILMPMTTSHLWLFYAIWTLENLFLCVADVVVDALVIERVKATESEDETKGSLQSACSTMRSLGKCVGALLGSFMFASGAGRQEVFYITAIAPLLVAMFSFFIHERQVISDLDKTRLMDDGVWEETLKTGKNPRNWKYYMQTMIMGFLKTDMWKFCMVATCYIISPDPEGAYFYYYQDILGMPDFALQMTSFAQEAGVLTGTVIFGLFLRTKPAKPLMIASTLVVVCMLMLQSVFVFLGPSSLALQTAFAYSYAFVVAIADVFLFMPLTIMAARLCTEGLEGTSYALVLSIQNLGGFLDNVIAAQIMNTLGISEGKMGNLWYMSFFCAFCFLSPMTMFHTLPDRANMTNSTQEGDTIMNKKQ